MKMKNEKKKKFDLEKVLRDGEVNIQKAKRKFKRKVKRKMDIIKECRKHILEESV